MPEEVTTREDLQVIQVKSYPDITIEDFKKTLDAAHRWASLLRLRSCVIGLARPCLAVLPPPLRATLSAEIVRPAKVLAEFGVLHEA